MLEAIMNNLINIGWAMLIFLAAYLSNVAFSLYYNIKILLQPFDREKAINSALKVAAFVVGLTLLCVSITTLPLYANQVGWAIPEEYADMFADLVIIGAVLIVSCKYIVEAFTKFKAILEVTPKMKLVQSILTKNDCYKSGRKITVKGLMLHSVGCPQPNASVFVKNWNRSGLEACVHGFIDGNTGTVYQTLPWNHRGWHAGGAANNTHIGVEMCEPACIKYTSGANFTCSDLTTAKAVAKRTYEAAVELFASLCKQYGLDPMKDGVIISHREGCARGLASNHGDPEHLWNQLGTGYTMNGFRKAVQAAMKGGGVTTTPNTEKPATGGTGATVKPYLVRVTIPDLYIRKGPGTNYGKNGFIKPGVYTIVEERTGAGASKWGKLKSGAGWISLDYAKRRDTVLLVCYYRPRFTPLPMG